MYYSIKKNDERIYFGLDENPILGRWNSFMGFIANGKITFQTPWRLQLTIKELEELVCVARWIQECTTR